MAIEQRPIRETGVTVSEIGFGVWTVAAGWWGEFTRDEAAALLREAYDLGVSRGELSGRARLGSRDTGSRVGVVLVQRLPLEQCTREGVEPRPILRQKGDDGVVCLGEGGTGGRLEHVPGRLDAAERVDAVDARIERRTHDVTLARPADAEPDGQALLGSQACQLGQDGRVRQDAALQRRRLCLPHANRQGSRSAHRLEPHNAR